MKNSLNMKKWENERKNGEIREGLELVFRALSTKEEKANSDLRATPLVTGYFGSNIG